MVRTYLKTAIRSFLKNKLGTSINLLGFSIGLAVAMLILSFVYHEMSYDTFHENSSRIYRIDVSLDINGDQKIGTLTPNILGPKLKNEIPGIEAQFRMTSNFNNLSTLIINDEQFQVENFFQADSTIFDVFTFNLIEGSFHKTLTKTEDAMLSRNSAMKFFGTTDIVGKTFKSTTGQDFVIRAVYEDFPSNSHIHMNFIASALSSNLSHEPVWDGINFITYLLIDSQASAEEVERRMDKLVSDNLPDNFKAINTKYDLIPIEDIHIHSKADFELEPTSDISKLYAYLAIAVFIILIACVNYINLATSQSLERAREVGLKKMVGARKTGLIWQFMIEASLITFSSIIVAVVLFEFFEPAFLSLVGKNIDLMILSNPKTIGMLIGAWLLLTLMAGFYPSIVLTSFKPIQILNGNFKHSRYGGVIRKSLVVFQFVISSTLIVGTLVVYNQINFMKNKKLGFAKDQILILSLDKGPEDNILNTFKKEILQHNNIENVSFSNAYPGNTRGGMLINAEGMSEDAQLLVWNWNVDEDYLKTMDLQLLAGKQFSSLENQGENQEYIINETAMHDIGWDIDDCIGRRINMGMWKGTCIGIVKDFNISSLQKKIEPLVLDVAKRNRRYVMVRFGQGDILETIDFIKAKWQNHITESVFTFHFLDESFDRLFAAEQQAGKTFSIFSILSILIASLGLFGLSAFETLSRTKEIGIRKSIGSSSFGIFRLLANQFSKLALLAFAISIPIIYIVMNQWLQGFAFKTSIGLMEFGIAAAITFAIVLISIGYHAIKAARTNPVDSLKYE